MKLRKYPAIGFFRHFMYTRFLGISMVNPLNYIEYNKADAKRILEEQLQWRDYGSKHFENVFTRFYQGYILPGKYGIDKRKSHYSTLICSGQITREEALRAMDKPPYESPELLLSDKEFFLKKLGLSEEDFDFFMKQPGIEHSKYPSYRRWYLRLRPIYYMMRRMGIVQTRS